MKHKAVTMLFLWSFALIGCSVSTGLDNEVKDNFSQFRGKSVGIVTNHTALDKQGDHLVDLITKADDVNLKAIFAPEHGFRGVADAGEHVKDNIDIKTGVPIYSLYGKINKPTVEQLKDIDVLIFDIQDIGARFYTYISTMGRIMEAGAENHIPVYILDRPNPIGRIAEGPIIEQQFYSGVGRYPIPVRHGLTVGELAMMIKDNGWINKAADLELHVIQAKGWDPHKPYVKAKQNWINPSPNIRNINEALVYPGTCLFEATNFSEGRGSEKPFEWVGAPYVNSADLIAELKKRDLEGIEISPVDYTPTCPADAYYKPKYNGELCHGVALTVTDPVNFKSLEFGIHLVDALITLYPDQFVIIRPVWMHKLFGNTKAFEMFESGAGADAIIKSYESELNHYISFREKYLLYK